MRNYFFGSRWQILVIMKEISVPVSFFHSLIPAMAFLALKKWGLLWGLFGANVNVGSKTRDVCKEQLYCS